MFILVFPKPEKSDILVAVLYCHEIKIVLPFIDYQIFFLVILQVIRYFFIQNIPKRLRSFHLIIGDEPTTAADELLKVHSLNDGDFFSISDLFRCHKDVLVFARLWETPETTVSDKHNVPCFDNLAAEHNFLVKS